MTAGRSWAVFWFLFALYEATAYHGLRLRYHAFKRAARGYVATECHSHD